MGKGVGRRLKIVCHSCLCTFRYRRTSGQINFVSKSDGMCPSEVGCYMMAGGNNKNNDGNGNAVFIVRKGGRVARSWQ